MTSSPHGTHITFYRLLLAAYQARERVRKHESPSGSNDPATTAILCVSAVEAMLGELAQISAVANHHRYGEGSMLRENLASYAQAYNRLTLERERGQVKRGLSAAMENIVGNPIDWGRSPFQDFNLILNLRNDIVHGNLGDIVVLDESGIARPKRSKTIVELQRKGLIHSDKGSPQDVKSSFEMAMTFELSDWAVKTTRNVAESVMNPQHLADAGIELQVVFLSMMTFPMLLAANGISDDGA